MEAGLSITIPAGAFQWLSFGGGFFCGALFVICLALLWMCLNAIPGIRFGCVLLLAAAAGGCAPFMDCRDVVTDDNQVIEVCSFRQCRDLRTGRFVRCP